MARRLSLNEARRIALTAQGFHRPRPSVTVTARHIRDVIHRLGLIQLDYATVLVPAHYQVLFSRLGPYQRGQLDRLVYDSREFTEQWAHEASIIPMATWPLLRHRMAAHRIRPYNFDIGLHQAYADSLFGKIRDRGAVTAAEVPLPEGTDPGRIGDWYRSVSRVVLEAHFGRGLLAIANRLPNFARTYDLAERVIPSPHYDQHIPTEDAHRELLLQAARALGVGTAADIADYFRMPVTAARPRLKELVEDKRLEEVMVDKWRETAFLHPQARAAVSIDACTLLSPFDPLVWYRPRLARLFEFDYRFEIFVPPAQRKWGCYVLPFLLGDRLVARVDLKSDRANRNLRVLSAYIEEHADVEAVIPPLTGELRTLASWLELDTVDVRPRGSFARRLKIAAGRARR